MATKKAAKKTPKKAAPSKVNKSEWVRSQPTDTPAAEVVAKAKSEGIVLSANFVYSIRQAARKKATGTTTSKGPGRPPATSKASGGGSMEMQFLNLVLDVGITRAEELIAQLKGKLRGITLR